MINGAEKKTKATPVTIQRKYDNDDVKPKISNKPNVRILAPSAKIWDRMKEANKGKAPPEFMSTHPSAANRIKKINEWINDVTINYPPIKLS